MPLPIWMVGIRDPAHAYMLRSSGMRRPRRRLRGQSQGRVTFGYAPLGSTATDNTPLSDAEIEELRTTGRELERQFMERFEDVERRHARILRATAAELVRAGAATLHTTEGDIHARAIPFRGGAVVLEVTYRGGWGQGRVTQSDLENAAVHQIASALAQAVPTAEPLTD